MVWGSKGFEVLEKCQIFELKYIPSHTTIVAKPSRVAKPHDPLSYLFGVWCRFDETVCLALTYKLCF